MSAKIISFVNFKGGVGKTALAVNLATSLAHQGGHRVLLVDLDPQSNASISLMGPEAWKFDANHNKVNTVYGLLKLQNTIEPCIVRGPVQRDKVIQVPQLFLLPACHDLMELELHPNSGDEEPDYVLFWKHISGKLDSYSFILIDCPPNLYRLTQCAIFASHHILVPCNPDALSAVGLSLLAKKVQQFKQKTAHRHSMHRRGYKQAEISGIIINNKPTAEVIANKKAEALIQTKLNSLKAQGLTAPDAEVLRVSIRHAADFRTGSFEYRPVLFAKGVKNKELLSDYENLANLIRTKFKGA
jgi:chromosome partitioning protein